ncbi:putative mannan endo-1,4-beta-mannosidase P [Podospora fimiseda]|uniref:mannan endo-1,4-beta-mannosidase n=1 Tax=Podospora fimiseda TaxID=252190 RepID=A0AAN7BY62_9PEZI|nr:putative mannan endo-1,4-beta-mannosidase P [Podospora fimiseda]
MLRWLNPPSLASPPSLRDTHITRCNSTLYLSSTPWKAVGPNIYWLGLDENVIPPTTSPPTPFYAPLNASYPTRGRITEIMAISAALGSTFIRSHTLGISYGNPLSLFPRSATLNPAAFDPIDWAIFQAREYGLRLMIPLVDNFDYYHGGKYTWLRWSGYNLSRTTSEREDPQVQEFYNVNGKVWPEFQKYIKTWLTHVNPYTNLTYAQDPTIFAIETGNELCGPIWGDMDVPADWVREFGRYVKSLAPEKLFVDGTYGVNQTHLNIEEVDIFSNHYYPISVAKLRKDLDLVARVDKPYFAGEYSWLGNTAATDANLTAWLRELESSPTVVGDAFWSLFGHNIPDCNAFVEHNDGLAMQYGNPDHVAQIQLVRQHFLKMSQGLSIPANEALPSVPCPAPTFRTLSGRPLKYSWSS